MESKDDEVEYELVASEGEDGWSEWMLPPKEKPFRMACCDCDLVHDMEFGTIDLNSELDDDGAYKIKYLDGERPIFRVRRNNSETTKLRDNNGKH